MLRDKCVLSKTESLTICTSIFIWLTFKFNRRNLFQGMAQLQFIYFSVCNFDDTDVFSDTKRSIKSCKWHGSYIGMGKNVREQYRQPLLRIGRAQTDKNRCWEFPFPFDSHCTEYFGEKTPHYGCCLGIRVNRITFSRPLSHNKHNYFFNNICCASNTSVNKRRRDKEENEKRNRHKKMRLE